MGGRAVALKQRVALNCLQKRLIRGDPELNRKTRILDRTQEVAGSSPASSMKDLQKVHRRFLR
jgi:hypothetical protein